jgi:exonuclease SbcD
MRMLHTADWHLGDRLGRIDRTVDLRRGVERIANYCHTEQVDVLIVAGDIFSEAARPDGLRDAIEHLRDTFAPFLLSGGTILAVTGNHDNETFCQTLRDAMSLAAPHSSDPVSSASTGRLYLATEPALVRLADRVSGDVVEFALMPFPTPAVFLASDSGRRYKSLAEKNDRLREAFRHRLNDLLSEPQAVHSWPLVLVAHVGVNGADLSNRFRISEETDIVIDPSTWPATFTYVALGHVHKPQSVGGHDHIRYCGSIERLDLGESADDKSVVLVDIGTGGLSAPPKIVPLAATPIYRAEVASAAQIDTLERRFSDHATALVNLHFSFDGSCDDLLDVQRRLESVFPRWYARDWHNRAELSPTLTVGEAAPKSFEVSIREYLEAELANLPDDQRTALVELAHRYMLTGHES